MRIVRLLLIGFAIALALTDVGVAFIRIREYPGFPDFNRDGHFSILDLLPAFEAAMLAPGHYMQGAFAPLGFAKFLEMKADPPNVIWSGVFSFIAWMLPVWVVQGAASIEG
ncbi:MAG: hypothetical protein ABI740_03065 [Alphaproteobacteria bacterium]